MLAPATHPSDPAPPVAGDIVDAYGPDSFPASDPPSWWAGAGDPRSGSGAVSTHGSKGRGTAPKRQGA
jgi:hypothetical protein